MIYEGGCYCGAVRYQAEGTPALKVQCHCRECQYISGGNPNVVIGMPETGFAYTKGAPKAFTRSDLEGAVTREFCANCGTQLLTRAPMLAGMMLIKVGTLDDPSLFGKPDLAIFTFDQQAWHHVPNGMPSFARMPG